MATYNKGILGPFTGTVGTVVGANWRGKNIMRSKPKKTTHVPSIAQTLQRERFSTITKFLNPIKNVYSTYFGQPSGAKSRYNLAVSYHLKEALIETFTGFEILYNKVLIAKGELQGVQEPTVVAQTGNLLKISWANNAGQGLALPTDGLLVVLFSEDLQLFSVYENAATRADGEVTLPIEAYFTTLNLHCWASFVNNERKLAASSTYLGEILVI